MKKVVVIGGGTGIFPVTAALKKIQLPLEIATIITVADNGGSTGRIRDEFGFQPVGDLRQSLAALAQDDGQAWIRKLLLYRFDRGSLSGHNLGNLLLTALQDMTGDTDAALDTAAQIFRIQGTVIPATKSTVDLKIVYEDGSVIIGEDTLDQEQTDPKKIDHIELTPPAVLNPRAAAAIADADYIIIGPGDYYASIMPALAPAGTIEAFQKTKAEVCYLLNLMTRNTQTKDMTAHDHVTGIEAAIGVPLATIIMNNQAVPAEILAQYAKHHEHPLEDDITADARVVKAALLTEEAYKVHAHDTAHRSVLRHDAEKLIPLLEALLKDL